MFGWFKRWREKRRHAKQQYEIMNYAVLREVKRYFEPSRSSQAINELRLSGVPAYRHWVHREFKYNKKLKYMYLAWLGHFERSLEEKIKEQRKPVDKKPYWEVVDWNAVEEYRHDLPQFKGK